MPAYLVETKTERILIDTGLNPAETADPAAYYGQPDIFAVSVLEQEQSVADQLDLSTLTKVVLTHLHWDHVGGLQLIPSSVPMSPTSPPAWTTTGFRSSPTTTISSDAPQSVYVRCVTLAATSSPATILTFWRPGP